MRGNFAIKLCVVYHETMDGHAKINTVPEISTEALLILKMYKDKNLKHRNKLHVGMLLTGLQNTA